MKRCQVLLSSGSNDEERYAAAGFVINTAIEKHSLGEGRISEMVKDYCNRYKLAKKKLLSRVTESRSLRA